jgi:hypothetical protein
MRNITVWDMEAAIAKLRAGGMILEKTAKQTEVSASIILLTRQSVGGRVSSDIILGFIAEPGPLKEPRPFQPLKQSRAMAAAQSRCRDFSPISISSKVADGWRR